jgi:hypothetical protein
MTDLLRDQHRKVLAALAEVYNEDGMGYCTFGRIADDTGLHVKQVRRSCRFLARNGWTHYGRGLWTEDGEPMGSGYSATKAGVDALLTHPNSGSKE